MSVNHFQEFKVRRIKAERQEWWQYITNAKTNKTPSFSSIVSILKSVQFQQRNEWS